MSEVIPSIFTKADFWAMLLPGYVTVILGIGLFVPSIISNTSSNPNINIFSAIIFIVAGPAVGFILWQIYFHLSSLFFFEDKRPTEILSKEKFNKKYEFERTYANLRLKMDDKDIAELDSIHSRYVFGMSTAVGLVIIALIAALDLVIEPHCSQQTKCMSMLIESNSILHQGMRAIVIIISILVVGITLYFGAYFDNERIRIPTVCRLIRRQNLGYIETCEQWRKKDIYRRVKRAGKNLQKTFKYEIKRKLNGKSSNIPNICEYYKDEAENLQPSRGYTIKHSLKRKLNGGSLRIRIIEFEIKKEVLVNDLIQHNLNKSSAYHMLDALIECNLLRLNHEVYIVSINEKSKLMSINQAGKVVKMEETLKKRYKIR